MGTYSKVGDLLTGDVTIGGSFDRDRYVQDATDEINSRIGFTYQLPLSPVPAEHIALTLKRCANLIATGRLVMAVAMGSEDASVHAYGASLLSEGQQLLTAIDCGHIDLGCAKLAVQSEGNAPTIVQADSSSAVDAFYGYVNGTVQTGVLGDPIWTPNT